MRVLMVSKACIVGIYQRKLEEIARCGVELLVVVPPSWRDERGETPLERVYTEGYRMEVLPMALNGSFHLHFYRGLGQQIREFRPQIVHIDEEPYNLAAWQSLFHAKRIGAKTLFFSWQNLNRSYPPPFSWGERWVLNNVDYALAGTDSAAQVWREKGYRGPMRVIAQFGTDAELFTPSTSPPNPLSTSREGELKRPFTIGYVGRLVEEKGVSLLLEAAAKLAGDWLLHVVGSGPLKGALAAQAHQLGVLPQVTFTDWLPSRDMPAQYRQLDALVVPSLTRPHWKEQFGRVLPEAMASGVAVIGSDCGAIPSVIGDAGLIFPEGDVSALADCLQRLQNDAHLRACMGEKGRARVLAHFTHEQVAQATVEVYREMVES
jgi:glycosyltransferase involved in cell wall biosynthesis